MKRAMAVTVLMRMAARPEAVGSASAILVRVEELRSWRAVGSHMCEVELERSGEVDRGRRWSCNEMRCYRLPCCSGYDTCEIGLDRV